MLPSLSIAGLAIHRNDPSGAYVPCWRSVIARDLSTESSYHRTPPPPAAVFTEWTATTVSRPPTLRYTSRAMILSPCASSRRSVPGCGTQLVSWPPHKYRYGATAIVSGPIAAVLDG